LKKIVKLKSKTFKLQNETKFNPFTGEKAPGFICFEVVNKEDRDAGEIISSIVEYLYRFKDKLVPLLKSHNGDIEIYLDISILSPKCPYIQLSHETIKKMDELNVHLETSIEIIN